MAEKGKFSALADKFKGKAGTSDKTAKDAAKETAGTSGSFAKPAATTAKSTTTAAKSTTTTVKPVTTAAKSAAGGFTDIPPRAYYARAVEWAVGKGITSGTTETTFSPDKPCHRGHAATFIWRCLGSPDPISRNNPFTDVSEGPFYQAILWAAGKNIIPGTTPTTFEPSKPCTRAQVLSYLQRAEGGKANATEQDGILWGGAKNLFLGQGGGPADPCTRADIVYYLYRLHGKDKA